MMGDAASKRIRQNLTLSLGVFLLSWLLLELVARWLVLPSDQSYGTLFGIELPPYVLIPPTTPPPQVDREALYDGLVVDGQRITVGDLWGIFRADSVLGYAPEENTTSVNGWWQTNNIGARARYDTTEQKGAGQKRMLVFGDSFAVGSRVRQEDAWPAVLDAQLTDWEVVNLGVDGYGVGQSYLRYQALAPRVEHDLVLFLFAPREDLWRDVNTRRDLADSWDLYWVMPRFLIEEGELNLVASPFGGETGIDSRGPSNVNQVLHRHLSMYDRFYFEWLYESPPVAGRSILYKLVAKAYGRYRRRTLRTGLLEPGSEALELSNRILEAMHVKERRHGQRFALAVLPSHRDLELFERDPSYSARWSALVSSVCSQDMVCLDLAEDLRQAPTAKMDKGYDGTHYGPRANQLIADLIREHLELNGMLRSDLSSASLASGRSGPD